MSEAMRRPVVATVLIVAGLVALRLLAAALTPLTFDEAYYWTWSKHLALSYFDHPPMVAVVIRLGTLIGGDTEFGVRVVSILLALPMSWAVWRATRLLFDDERIAATATLLLNATMMVSVGTTIVTPDAPLLVASSFVLLALAQVAATGSGVWWLAVGVAVGLALLSKYTALFFGPAILIWLLWVPSMRRWLISPWPYLGGVIAFALFSPVVIWNAQHDWISFVKQLGRAKLGGFEPKFLAELIPTQFVLATPFVFVLGVVGLIALGRRSTGPAASRVLVAATVWTIALYFAWQALHDRVEANWLSPLYPAFAIAAAVGAAYPHWKPGVARLVTVCRRWAVSTGAVLFALVVVQVNTGALTGYRRDATVRSVGVGVAEMVAQIDQVRRRIGASCVLTDDYGTTGWLEFYLPPGTCVVQRGERFRWLAAPAPTPEQLAGPLLLVGVDNAAARPDLQAAFGRIERVGAVTRSRGPLLVDAVALDALSEPKGAILDQRPPIY